MPKLSACLLFVSIWPLLLFTGSTEALSQTTPLVDAPPSTSTTEAAKPFFIRFADAYQEDWHPTKPAGPDPLRRGYPGPLDSPPFPGNDYSVGGTPVIGAPDTQTYSLMQAINENRSRVKIYGWLNGGFNVSTSNKGDGANSPAAYYYNPNRITPDQQVLYIERLPDTVQTEHVDWGFRFAQLWGQDYRYTTSKGIFSQQLLARNHEYGYDPVMFYFDLYIPHVAKGMNIRMGRYISPPDIEAQLAPNNYTYSHSLLYTIDPYTQTGIIATIKLSDHWLIQGGFSGGNDVAPWTKDVKPTATVCANYTWHKGGDALYICANSINDGKYAYNNVQSYYETWYHKINATWHTDTETWYMYERDVPNIGGNVANPIKPETGANGAFCSYGEKTCFAPEIAVVNYLEKQLSHKSYLSIRNEFVDDIKGQRTGYATKYSEHLIGYGHWIGSTVLFRPEIRLEHSYDLPAYDLGTKKTQFIVAGDLTYHF
jgi:Putative beta-barrel porin-2, OmpL-like. bbp2